MNKRLLEDTDRKEKTINDACKKFRFWFDGVNRECISDFIQGLLESPIDFETVNINEFLNWFLDWGYFDKENTKLPVSLSSVIRDRERFVNSMPEWCDMVNPLIYDYALDVVNSMEKSFITYDDRYAYYTEMLAKAKEDSKSTEMSKFINAYRDIREFTERLKKLEQERVFREEKVEKEKTKTK